MPTFESAANSPAQSIVVREQKSTLKLKISTISASDIVEKPLKMTNMSQSPMGTTFNEQLPNSPSPRGKGAKTEMKARYKIPAPQLAQSATDQPELDTKFKTMQK